MLKKYTVAIIFIVAFIIVGLVSCVAEAPDPFNVYLSLYTMTDNCMFVEVDEDVADVASGVPVVTIYPSSGKGWICRYNLGEYSCICYQGTTMGELEVLEYLMCAVADASDISILDEYAVFVTYGNGTTNSYIKPMGDVIAEFMKRKGLI